jgi:hypothetical protein
VVEVVTTDVAVWQRRLEDRGSGQVKSGGPQHKPATWEQLQQLIAGYKGCHLWPAATPPEHYLVLDTSLEPAHMLQARTLDYLSAESLL